MTIVGERLDELALKIQEKIDMLLARKGKDCTEQVTQKQIDDWITMDIADIRALLNLDEESMLILLDIRVLRYQQAVLTIIIIYEAYRDESIFEEAMTHILQNISVQALFDELTELGILENKPEEGIKGYYVTDWEKLVECAKTLACDLDK